MEKTKIKIIKNNKKTSLNMKNLNFFFLDSYIKNYNLKEKIIMKKPMLFILFLLFTLNLFSNNIIIKATKVEKGPKIDGYLNDAVWNKAIEYSDFKMVEPDINHQPTEKTTLKILYDKNNLYFGIFCYDSNPALITANSMKTDYRGRSNDTVRILLDTFQDKRNAYVFFINPKGARSDGLAYGEHFSLNWDGIWDAKTKILKNGWSVEIIIPFKTLGFNPKLKTWGINVERLIAKKMEVIRLSGLTRDSFFYNPNEAATLVGISNIKQGKGITVKPYLNMNTTKDFIDDESREYGVTGGIDIYKNFTPNLTGAFSYNTDFAETEADTRKINLTRFSMFFPEKRGFFLEGSEIFSFGAGLHRSFIPFFSRKIGIAGGEQIPILFGAKMFGKIGNTNLALLDVKTKAYEEYPEKNYFAGRISQNIFEQGKVGIIFTDGDPETSGTNRLLGMDFLYSTSKFLGKKNFSTGGWVVYNWNQLEKGKHYGFGGKVDYPNDLIDAFLSYNYFGDSLNPGLGFLPRNNVQILNTGLAIQPRPQKGIIGKFVRQFFFEFYTTFYWDLSGEMQTWRVFTAPINLRTESGEHIEFNVMPNYDLLHEPFEISEGVIIPPGGYHFTRYRFEINTASFRKINFDLSYRFGEFYSGHLGDFNLGLGFKLDGFLNLHIESEFVSGNLPQGKFNENLFRIKADIFFSPDLALLNYIQYDDVSKTLGANIRFMWRISPGNKIFLTFNKNWEKRWDPRTRFIPLYDRIVFKIVYSWRP
jgi:hypothetical protein